MAGYLQMWQDTQPPHYSSHNQNDPYVEVTELHCDVENRGNGLLSKIALRTIKSKLNSATY